jgi:hypothetical protein
MTLTQVEQKKICDFVKIRPRSIQEIAGHIKKNWRTADRYVDKIADETGFLGSKIFREGTRGALKIVFWNLNEDIHSTSFQNELMEDILKSKHKYDFSPFEIYQHIENKLKKAHVANATKTNSEVEISEEQDLIGTLRKANKQVVIFSGNLSWINAKQGKIPMINIIRELAKRNISIKIIARVSMVGINNIKKLLAINKEIGRDIIEIKHRYQPMRAILIDNKHATFKEVKDPAYYQEGEIRHKIEIFYEIYDKDWIEWLQKIFWKMFSSAMSAEKRIQEIEKIDNAVI